MRPDGAACCRRRPACGAWPAPWSTVPVRDVDESRELGYPVFARGRIAEHTWNEPVVIGGIEVRPGDLVIADGSGVVFVSADRVEEVVSVAEALAACEARLSTAVRNGRPVGEVMDAGYEAMMDPGKTWSE